MTHPLLIVVGREPGSADPRIWLRALLYSTSRRNQVVESIFVRIKDPLGENYRFGLWGIRQGSELAFANGLTVGENGNSSEHRFMLPSSPEFAFQRGRYICGFYAALVGRSAYKILEVEFFISGEDAAMLAQQAGASLYLFWDSEAGHYVAQPEPWHGAQSPQQPVP